MDKYTKEDLEWYITNHSTLACEKRLWAGQRLPQADYDRADEMAYYFLRKEEERLAAHYHTSR